MEYRQLGRSGLRVSVIGLGGNTFGRYADQQQTTAIVRQALDSGVNMIDTADVYGNGVSEELLGNAIRFTPQGGTITASVRPGHGEETAVFGVRDTGDGIPREAFERIFEKFGQVEMGRDGQKLSTGLGLTLCKMVVEAHGGQI